MNISIDNYIFLSMYIPLPLSALKLIEREISHPFHAIYQLNREEILLELNKLNKKPGISIRKASERARKADAMINDNIYQKIHDYIEEWKREGLNMFPFFNDKYPSRLKNVKNPPKIIFTKGNLNFDYSKAISIVGTRNPTQYGSKMARDIAYRFAILGFTVVNGFAKGVDTYAMEGCLEAGGKVIGVLGSGLFNIYPKENKEFFHKIVNNDEGLFMSEQLPEKPVLKTSLPARNRISSALSIGNVFIEGSLTSGTRWQLMHAKEQDKPIIVLKPKENVKQTQLTGSIIKDEKKAYIIEKLEDVDEVSRKIIDLANKKKRENKNKKQQTNLTDF